ncbi:hypothetical protein CSUB01_00830 [Colletotrichum sublineola]|uniref:Protein-lysine N-methyltransferase EFM6 n=1 Tax=Colletotrichum sublineola TaxID=1173701 RepID=A0A066X0G0_COLSU|nr:hypothetical protein CSUB01_00830 [Colletotrichum sublineola]
MRVHNTSLIPEQMESADRSPSPDFSPLAIGEDLTPLPAYKAAQTSSYDICGLLSTPLKLHEDLTSGCGGQTWPAGMVLTKHMLRYQREALKGAKMGGSLAQEVIDFKPNVILAADCVYFEPAFPLLLETLTNLLSLEPSATVYFCFKKRRRADMQFLKKAKKAFQVTEIFDDDRAIFSREGLFLYTFTSKKPITNVNTA